MSLLDRLGDWAADIAPADVPEPARSVAKGALLDFLGVTVAAADTPAAGTVAAYLDAAAGLDGPATVIASGRRTGIEHAAFANGVLGHALDFDDVSHTLGGHPTVVVAPAALALAEARGASGLDVLVAYAVGVEVATQIARAVNFVHYDKGWHPTATLGVFGAAAAGARVLGLDGTGTVAAISFATAFSAGLKSSFGTIAKPVQVGRASMGGVTAALLASVGASGNPGAFEHKQGFATVFNGPGLFDVDAATAHLADPWDLEEPGIALKRHPCCGGTHAAVDAGLAARGQIAELGDVERVDVYIHPARYAHLDRPTIGSDPLEAKFSLQYTTALALLHGEVALDHFRAEVLEEPQLLALRDRVVAHPLPEDRCGPERFAAEVHVTLRDGTTVAERLERPIGRTPETALTQADIEAKFRMCTRTQLTEPEQTEILDIVWALEAQPDVRRLATLLRGAA